MIGAVNHVPVAMRYGAVFTVAAGVTLLATPLTGRLAIRLGLVDGPASNKAHGSSTPVLGGLHHAYRRAA